MIQKETSVSAMAGTHGVISYARNKHGGGLVTWSVKARNLWIWSVDTTG